jgi:hypothetical protein
MNYQSTKNENCHFSFSHKINGLQASILAAHPCAAGTSELVRGCLMIKPDNAAIDSI